MNFTRQSKDSIQLMERSPAACFEQAYPIGNGHQGAVVYGGTEVERISLNDDTLWSGYPDPEPFRGDGFASLERAKAHVLKGDYVSANTELTGNFGCYASASYMPLGDLHITFGKNAHKVSGYRRTLDLRRAVASASYKRGDVTYAVTAFASYPDRVVIYRIEAKQADGTPAPVIALSASFSSQLYARTYTENGLLLVEGECPVISKQTRNTTDRKTRISSARH